MKKTEKLIKAYVDGLMSRSQQKIKKDIAESIYRTFIRVESSFVGKPSYVSRETEEREQDFKNYLSFFETSFKAECIEDIKTFIEEAIETHTKKHGHPLKEKTR